MNSFPGDRCGFVSLLAIVVWAALGAASLAGGELVISQRARQFQPGTATIEKGQTLVLVNDDGKTVHHAYVESDSFNYDSGDQNPGSRTRIVFPSKGDFLVLCGIHPNMKLHVHVK